MIGSSIIADSVSCTGKRITTFEIELPKVLLAEFNTHRMISKNFSSSRAIPNASAVQVESFEPVFWGKNQSGMVAKDEEIQEKQYARAIWLSHIDVCKEVSKKLADIGLHKQWANRPNDWHTMARGVATATEWQNFFNLRAHSDAQPEIAVLAKSMHEAMMFSKPMLLNPNEWHLPYIERTHDSKGMMRYSTESDGEIDLETAKIISASCCAQVSYRKADTSLEKALRVYSMLNINTPDTIPHFSPLEHQATPMSEIAGFTAGVTHMDKRAKFWSGNFQGWIQYRQLVMNLNSIECMG